MCKNYSLPVFLVCLLSALLLAGCDGDRVKDDMLNYFTSEIPKIVSYEDEITGIFDDALSQEDDLLILEEINNKIIPKYKSYIVKLGSVKLSTPEIKELHEFYIKAANAELDAFMQMAAAIEKNDPDLIAPASAKLVEAREAVRDFYSLAGELAKQHNLRFENQ